MARPSNIKVAKVGEDTVGIITESDVCLFTPQVSVEIAVSLIDVAKEQDPSMDVEAVMKEYRKTHPFMGDKVTYIN